MQKYLLDKKPPAYFVQGFIYGLIFGTIGALVMLGRRGRESTTL